MKHRALSAIIAVGLVVSAGAAFAEEHFGVQVYAGAKSDAATEGYCRRFIQDSEKMGQQFVQNGILKVQGVCFRTTDAFEKIVEFYGNQKGLDPLGKPSSNPNGKTAVFCQKGLQCAAIDTGIDVTISRPWMDERTHDEVMIVIRKSIKK